ncbi:MAG TPA: multidrug ABC transporter substrate-binding protein [Candidatus Taylorbacteria bacterium]|nr:MAG: ABC-type antimicrobial peptide transport system, permease component [Parcubacteria group bacterium GW2011_GWA2_47_64]KKU96299.1 MAG: ABC-type antimicrobial peptide transport system, permease component [Parcubacteria group bacterium GW2011_GWC2_48_17]HBV01222.1 multidrug ABC transporter substrate-binding protein [Candidatus Taylorbacteria bacterium]
MTFKHSLKTALSGLRSNRSRSALTILGIVIGITAIMLVLSLGAGAQNLILDQVQGMGAKTIVVIPGRQPSGPSDFANVFLDSLKERDLRSLQSKLHVPYAEDIMPIVFGTVRTAYKNETYQVTVLGGGNKEKDSVMEEMFDVHPERGSFFTAADVQSKAPTAVIGDKVREHLFGDIDPLGKKMRIKDKTFQITGVLGRKGQVSFFNFDDMVLVPYTTAQQYLLGRKYFDRIIVSADSEEHIEKVVSDIKGVIRANHDITDPEKDDFFVETQADLAERLKTITTALTLFLSGVAGISLFVGGVGIMNIMLVSVTERTREIGLRKAVGATNKDILTQFLFEAVILTLFGGIIGTVLGSSLSFVISFAIQKFALMTWGFSFPYLGAMLGLFVSAIVGLVFGLYPARRASQLNPIDALRHE